MRTETKSSVAITLGWAFWWLTIVIMVAIIAMAAFWPIPASAPVMTRSILLLVVLVAFIYFAVLQILSGVALYQMRRSDSYAWPIVLIVMGCLGLGLYIISGVWGIINLANQPHRENESQ